MRYPAQDPRTLVCGGENPYRCWMAFRASTAFLNCIAARGRRKPGLLAVKRCSTGKRSAAEGGPGSWQTASGRRYGTGCARRRGQGPTHRGDGDEICDGRPPPETIC